MFLHIDLDAFFASAAVSVDESLQGKLVAVASGDKIDIFGDYLKPGIILSANYAARAFGVKCTMHSSLALKLCPNLIILPTNFKLYTSLSSALFKLLLDYTNEIEKYSIDEYFLDITGSRYQNSPKELANIIKLRIEKELKLPSSIGIAPTKYMAKLATDLAKPSGVLQIIEPSQVGSVAIEKFPGVGKSLAKKLKNYGISTLQDAFGAGHVFMSLGKAAASLHLKICGLDSDKIVKNSERKSLAIARSFEPIKSREEIDKRLLILSRHLYFELLSLGLRPSKFELKIRYKNQNAMSTSKSLNATLTHKFLITTIRELFKKLDNFSSFEIDYLSICCGGFDRDRDGSLFDIKNPKDEKISQTLYKIQKKYGIDAIKRVTEL